MIRVRLVGDALLQGQGIGKKAADGPVCIIDDLASLEKNFTNGCVLVMRAAEEAYMKYIAHAGAVISEEEGISSHSAVAIITTGVPGIVGAKNATKILKNGDIVTVDSVRGTVFHGVANAR
jgi:pyruvate kinase